MGNPLSPPLESNRDMITNRLIFELWNRYPTRMTTLDRRDQQGRLEWVWASNGELPSNAVALSTNAQGQPTYIGRVHRRRSIIPGVIVPKLAACSVDWKDRWISKVYEVLCTPGRFLPITESTTNGLLHASTVGTSETGEPLFLGRAQKAGTWYYGTVVRSRGLCYIPIEGSLVKFSSFEVFAAGAPQVDPYYWKPLDEQGIPPGAAVGGYNEEHGQFYIGRVYYLGISTPGMVSSVNNWCYASYSNYVHSGPDCDVLCNCSGKFIKSKLGEVPVGAIKGGYSGGLMGEPFFIGRVKVNGSFVIGRVQVSQKACIIPLGGRDVPYEEYEIFVLEQHCADSRMPKDAELDSKKD